MTRGHHPHGHGPHGSHEGHGAGVARSRSEALAWSVRLVGQHADEWLRELRSAMEQVERVRAKGPDSAGEDAPAQE